MLAVSRGGFIVEWYGSSYGTDVDNSEIASSVGLVRDYLAAYQISNLARDGRRHPPIGTRRAFPNHKMQISVPETETELAPPAATEGKGAGPLQNETYLHLSMYMYMYIYIYTYIIYTCTYRI